MGGREEVGSLLYTLPPGAAKSVMADLKEIGSFWMSKPWRRAGAAEELKQWDRVTKMLGYRLGP